MDQNFNKGQLLLRIGATMRFTWSQTNCSLTVNIADCFHLFESESYFTQLRNNQLSDIENLEDQMGKTGEEYFALLISPLPTFFMFEKFSPVFKGPRSAMLKFKTPSTCEGGCNIKIVSGSASGFSKYFLMNRISQEFGTLENIHSLSHEKDLDFFVTV